MAKGEIVSNFKTAFCAGIGLALKGKKKLEEVAKKFIENNKAEADTGKKFIDKAIKHVETTKNELSKKINETAKTTASKIGFITRKEADNLKNEIERLRSQLHKSKKEKK
jgi:polyhydroxyalkanoate synthesis regulator phasin